MSDFAVLEVTITAKVAVPAWMKDDTRFYEALQENAPFILEESFKGGALGPVSVRIEREQ